MQARQGSETVVLGFVAVSLAVVVGSVAAMHLVSRLELDIGPAPGDHFFLTGPESGFSSFATAALPSGRECQIGLGRDAVTNADVYIVRRGPDGDVAAIWSSSGRSSATGPDCGNGAEIKLDREMFSRLAGVAHGGNPVVVADTAVF